MKTLLNILKWLAIVLLVAVAGLKLSGNGFLLKGLWATYLHGHVTASISDARFFDTRTVAAGTPQPWPLAPDHNKATLSPALRKSLEDTRTVAFLIVKDGQLKYEEYWDGYTDTSRTNSFSMAKSITTMLVQCAIQDGLVQGWDQPAMDFLPELKGEFAPELTLRHLCTMTAGLDFNEHYSNPV
jgi:CubicO group peptidase (beta-lactamase class C family)